MRGDFSRDTYAARRYFRRVLMQQGRVLLDADVNEQQSIVLHFLEALAADLLGPSAGTGFEIGEGSGREFGISVGHYYVDGILCENDPREDDATPLLFTRQPDPFWDPENPPELQAGNSYLVYLDVWERHIAGVEDSTAPEDAQRAEPSIVEVALGGPDTCSRSVLVWQAKTEPGAFTGNFDEEWNVLRERWQPTNRGRLEAESKDDDPNTDPCNIRPESQFRGAENQLYRVEIHANGVAGGDSKATLKWSRDNGSIVFPIRSISTDGAELDHLGRDDRSTLQPGDWVELVDDTLSLRDRLEPLPPLLSIEEVDRVERRIRFKQTATELVDPTRHAYLRRWDHGRRRAKEDIGTIGEDGTIEVIEDEWIVLEDGVRIRFQQTAPGGGTHTYRRGDYWLIPARVATGDVDWPRGSFQPPRGVDHHFAALAVIDVGTDNVSVRTDPHLRRQINPSVS